MIPNKLIYRRDEKTGEEYSVYFTAGTVRNSAYDYLKTNRQHNTTLEHEASVEGVTLVESWIVEGAHDKALHLGYDVPVGTWMVALRVDNDAVWQMVKEGAFQGFSIEGFFIEQMAKQPAKHGHKSKMKMNLVDRVRAMMKPQKFATANMAEGEGTITNGKETDFAVGDELFVVTPEGENLPLPDGEYPIEGGAVLIVAEGVLSEMTEAAMADDKTEEEMTGAEAILAKLDAIAERIGKLEASSTAVKKTADEAKASADEAAEALDLVAAEMKALKDNATPPPPTRKRTVTSKTNPSIPERRGPHDVKAAAARYFETYS